MKAKHTPGPWKWELYAGGWALVSETVKIGSVRQGVDLSHEGPNAQILETAPDLLEALEKTLLVLESLQGEWVNVTEIYAPKWTHNLKAAVTGIEAALKKATA